MTICRNFLGCAAVAIGAVVVSVGDAEAAWEPSKPIEFVIMAGQGSGADRLARFIQIIVEKQKLSPTPLVPINKGDGSGEEALRYLVRKKGNPHVIMTTLNSLYTTPLRNPGIKVDISEFTPIARLAEDAFVLWVNTAKPIESVENYVATAREKRGRWKMGGTGAVQEDYLVTQMLKRAYDISMTYIPFTGGGAVLTALVGKKLDSSVNNLSEAIGFMESGDIRPLASLTIKRIPGLDQVPTFGELGHPELVYYMQYSIVAPGKIKPDVAAFYRNLFRKVYDTPEWQDYCKGKALQCAWLQGDELKNYFRDGLEKHRNLLKQK